MSIHSQTADFNITPKLMMLKYQKKLSEFCVMENTSILKWTKVNVTDSFTNEDV